MNRSNMGHYNATTDPAVQRLTIGRPEPINGNWFTPANWNGYVYFGGMNESVMAFKFTNGLLLSSPSSQTTKMFGYPVATATVSSSGTSNGIVWVLDNSKFVGGDLVGGVNTPGPAILHAIERTTSAWSYTTAVRRARATLQAQRSSSRFGRQWTCVCGRRETIDGVWDRS